MILSVVIPSESEECLRSSRSVGIPQRQKQALRNDKRGQQSNGNGVYRSRREPGALSSVLKDMKQYLVVKIAKRLGALALEAIPVAGLFPLEAAEQFVRNAVADEPGSLFLIQQVGNA